MRIHGGQPFKRQARSKSPAEGFFFEDVSGEAAPDKFDGFSFKSMCRKEDGASGISVRTTWRLPACRACRSLVFPARLVCSIYVAACGARRRPSRLGLLCVLHLRPPSVLPPPSPFNPCGGGALGFPSRSELCAMKGALRMC